MFFHPRKLTIHENQNIKDNFSAAAFMGWRKNKQKYMNFHLIELEIDVAKRIVVHFVLLLKPSRSMTFIYSLAILEIRQNLLIYDRTYHCSKFSRY